MFIHKVLFRIQKRHVPLYRTDCLMWAREASRHPGFLGYRTLERTDHKGQYASLYMWKSRPHHERFMKKHHDRLVSLSKCPVEVLGYYNYRSIQALR